MDDFMIEWAMNSVNQTEAPFQQANEVTNLQNSESISDYNTIVPPVIDAINNNQISFLQTVEPAQGNNSTWNSYDYFKATQMNFGGTENLNFTSHDLSKEYEEIGSNKQMQGTRMNSQKAHSQDHVIAERKRREKINQRLAELSSIIPCTKKTDKVSILIDAVNYVKELQERVKTLEARNPNLIDTAVLVKDSYLSSQDADHGCSSSTNPEPLPVIKAQLSEDIILISIHCVTFKGLLLKLLSVLENLNLTITHTSLMPFSSSTSFITLTAQIEGPNKNAVSAEDVVKKLSLTLN
ncbi:basic helix-loop-helix (bHLH) DNA-binding superfamily protein [Rhynchospora pubera]|uniref:Basic helix-loop-helix (BHLH) DNA-binding superfamily protein n=1 Tax=Rhynchospora pubera TaxID=906938 RepID=A0AAV8GMR8_9POAL|nr:basic helix-loop-helix (bHLH) DNA-binding superfamily protein [Rhynchospora pubera]KAJ4804338.1 basic helix-loop-helix (bHLH) DNA-binding superfamily protein [Rhynchospora pubera]